MLLRLWATNLVPDVVDNEAATVVAAAAATNVTDNSAVSALSTLETVATASSLNDLKSTGEHGAASETASETALEDTIASGFNFYKHFRLARHKVIGDGNCWIYVLLACVGLMESVHGQRYLQQPHAIGRWLQCVDSLQSFGLTNIVLSWLARMQNTSKSLRYCSNLSRRRQLC